MVFYPQNQVENSVWHQEKRRVDSCSYSSTQRNDVTCCTLCALSTTTTTTTFRWDVTTAVVKHQKKTSNNSIIFFHSRLLIRGSVHTAHTEDTLGGLVIAHNCTFYVFLEHFRVLCTWHNVALSKLVFISYSLCNLVIIIDGYNIELISYQYCIQVSVKDVVICRQSNHAHTKTQSLCY